MDYMEENEELYRAWIGTKNQDKNFEKMKKSSFKLIAGIFPHLLLITRKMYVEAFVLLIIEFIIDFIMELLGIAEQTSTIIYFAICLTTAFSYYSLYEWSIRRKIKKYREQGISDEQQINIAQECGGDKITLKVVIAIIAFVILNGILAIVEGIILTM